MPFVRKDGKITKMDFERLAYIAIDRALGYPRTINDCAGGGVATNIYLSYNDCEVGIFERRKEGPLRTIRIFYKNEIGPASVVLYTNPDIDVVVRCRKMGYMPYEAIITPKIFTFNCVSVKMLRDY